MKVKHKASNLISDIMINCKKFSSKTFHESVFVKALVDLDVPIALVKRHERHLQMLKVCKNGKPQTMMLADA